ncbi:MAG: acetylornithine transaminase [bacterium]
MTTQALAATEFSTAELLRDSEKSLMYVVTRPDQVFVRGKGSYLWDAGGRRYLDFIQGWAVNCLGHSPPVLVRAIRKQAGQLLNGSPILLNEPMIRLAGLLTGNSCMDKVFFANSGAEANEGALKLARKYGKLHLGGAHQVVTTWNAFHGRTLAMMSASGKKAWDDLFEPKVPGFTRVDFNDLRAVRDAITPQTCAVMIELVQGEAGVFVADKKYVKGLRQLCDERGILLIFDEIQTGIGRIGTLFGYEHYGVEPDIITLGKGLGGGFPVSALLAKDRVCVFEQGDQGGTYCAQPLAMAAGAAVVGEVIAKKIPARARSRGRTLIKRLREMVPEFGFSNIRGLGLLVALDLPGENAAKVVEACFDEGLIVNAPRPASLRFMPALNVSNAEVDEMVTLLARGLRKAG